MCSGNCKGCCSQKYKNELRYEVTTEELVERGEKPPSYLTINGFVYERVDSDSVPVAFELDDDVAAAVEENYKKEGFISPQEYVRHVLREFAASDKVNEVFVKKAKKSTKK